MIGLRLYVEAANLRAQQTYHALGLKPGGYEVYARILAPRLARFHATLSF